MANLTIPNTFSNSTVADATAVNANFTAVATLLNSTGLDSTGLASNSVTTPKIADSNVTTAKIADANITTAKIATGAVTAATKAALNYTLGATSGPFIHASTSYYYIPAAAITTTGRPVLLMIQPAEVGVSPGGLQLTPASGSPTGMTMTLQLERDTVAIASSILSTGGAASSSLSILIPPSFSFIDTGATAGAHSYRLGVKSDLTSTTTSVLYLQLVAIEL